MRFRKYLTISNLTFADFKVDKAIKIFKTSVVIIGAGPSGLAAREMLNKYNVANIVIDNNDKIGGQFLMQTHQFFFFEKRRNSEACVVLILHRRLAGDDHSGIFLNSTVWDLLDGKRVAVKNMLTGEIFYVDADYLVVAAGAVPFMPTFENDDVPGVYTAAVVQKMMNSEFTLLGKKCIDGWSRKYWLPYILSADAGREQMLRLSSRLSLLKVVFLSRLTGYGVCHTYPYLTYSA